MIVILNLTNNDRGINPFRDNRYDEVYKTFNPFRLGMALGRMDLSGEIPGNLSAPLQGFT